MTAELLGQPVLHADETRVAMLRPAGQRDGKTLQVSVFDLADNKPSQPR